MKKLTLLLLIIPILAYAWDLPSIPRLDRATSMMETDGSPAVYDVKIIYVTPDSMTISADGGVIFDPPISEADTLDTVADRGATTDQVLTVGGVIVSDDDTIGFGAGKALIQFDDQTTDEINFLNCNVGIGTSNPEAPFQVSASGGVYVTTTDFDTGTLTGSMFEVSPGADTGNTYIKLRALTDSWNDWGNLILQDGGGKVGIGTTAPDKKLEINTGAATNGVRISYNDGDGSATTYSDLLIDSSGDLEITTTGGDISFGDENLSTTGTIEGGTLTEGGNAVYNSTETPGGILGGTWASPTIDAGSITDSHMLSTDDVMKCQFGFVFDGGGSAISPDAQAYVRIPYNCTLLGWDLTGDTSGTITADAWVDSYANFPPTDADSITNGHEPTIPASGIISQDLDITDWSDITMDAGDYIMINIDGCTSITYAEFSLYGYKN